MQLLLALRRLRLDAFFITRKNVYKLKILSFFIVISNLHYFNLILLNIHLFWCITEVPYYIIFFGKYDQIQCGYMLKNNDKNIEIDGFLKILYNGSYRATMGDIQIYINFNIFNIFFNM